MKSGFVVLAGRSNVGKSTLMNELVGTKVAIVTPKPQTTRVPVRGVYNDTRGQLVFVDTPGFFLGKRDPVSERLNEFVKESLEGIDAIVYVMDPTREPGAEEDAIQDILRQTGTPIIAVVNKSDLAETARPALQVMRRVDVGQIKTLEISAKRRQDLNTLIDALFDLMPEGEPFYPEFQLTDLSQKQWIEELIREKAFLNLEKELPYTVKVEVTELEQEGEDRRRIAATIWTTEDRYKGMLIGARGQMIKEIGMTARKELEAATNLHIHLELTVKVDPKWPQRFGV